MATSCPNTYWQILLDDDVKFFLEKERDETLEKLQAT